MHVNAAAPTVAACTGAAAEESARFYSGGVNTGSATTSLAAFKRVENTNGDSPRRATDSTSAAAAEKRTFVSWKRASRAAAVRLRLEGRALFVSPPCDGVDYARQCLSSHGRQQLAPAAVASSDPGRPRVPPNGDPRLDEAAVPRASWDCSLAVRIDLRLILSRGLLRYP